jgi:hypothetical protein
MTLRHLLRAAVICAWGLLAAAPAGAGQYQNFNVAIYVAVGSTRQLADERVRQEQYERIASQLKFDKVYLEVYRDRQIAEEASLDGIKKFFAAHGVAVSGGVTLAAGGQGGQFGTFDYEDPKDREECRRAVELAARHFDEIILDDFFFYTSKSDADIAAKGSRSWTQYRLDKMREAAANLVLAPARKVNPRVKVIIKYPNWYEHFQGLGYDLDVEAKQFDAIYTGTESRDPYITDQLLQQYLSYSIFRYFDNVRPGGANRGGWVDTFSTRYIDRYAEQLWDTLFAKAPEITLFNWSPFVSTQAVQPGDRAAWADKATSFVWDDMVRSFKAPAQGSASAGWARAAGYSLEQIDPVIGKLGKPIGVASYKPFQSSGEDFLHTYLGNIGIPIELTPTFPEQAPLVFLAESSKHDRQIVQRIKKQLTAGKSVVITSGLLRALQSQGINDIVELEYTDHRIAIREFLNAYGAGNGTSLNDAAHDNPPVLFPEIRFLTNDSWTLIRGVASAKGFPILLMNRYSRGVLYVLTIPDNMGDLYSLPQGVTNVIKAYLQPNFPVRIDAPSGISLFAYDNGTFVVQSFLPSATPVKISVSGTGTRIRNLVSSAVTVAQPPPSPPPGRRREEESARSTFAIDIAPHSYAAFAVERAD